jgi:very-short-patch-repair endonuclease
MTPAEKQLWFELGKRRLEGASFRRQAVIGPFVVDFASHRAMLVIELVHRVSDVALPDGERSDWIEERGYKIMRFSNAQVIEDCPAIADQILVQARARMRVIGMMLAHDPFEARPK